LIAELVLSREPDHVDVHFGDHQLDHGPQHPVIEHVMVTTSSRGATWDQGGYMARPAMDGFIRPTAAGAEQMDMVPDTTRMIRSCASKSGRKVHEL
jgi:hypothetical protein